VTTSADLDPIRAGFLARLADKLDGARVPGGDVAAWLAPLPTAALAAATFLAPEAARAALFQAVGTARSHSVSSLDQNLYEGSPLNVPTSPLAGGALSAWAAVCLARDLLATGLALDAKRVVCGAIRKAGHWPDPILRRFGPQLAALHAEAERMLARHLSDEVA